MNMTRIPEYDRSNPDGALCWFAEMSVRGLLFNPDDAPEDIIRSATGERLFTPVECAFLRKIGRNMVEDHGADGVDNAAYWVFMRAANITAAFDA
ncbi:MAG: hypothetical protein QM769_10495 [Pseudoxanthomonas sp.]